MAAAYSAGSEGALFGHSAGEDLFGRPCIDRVGGGLDLEHPVRDVLGHSLLGVAGASGATLEFAELTSALVHRHDPGLGVELGLDHLVLILAGDLAHPA